MKRNTAWTITAKTPLLRPGLEVSITVSEKYVVEEIVKLLQKVRETNTALEAPQGGAPMIKREDVPFTNEYRAPGVFRTTFDVPVNLLSNDTMVLEGRLEPDGSYHMDRVWIERRP